MATVVETQPVVNDIIVEKATETMALDDSTNETPTLPSSTAPSLKEKSSTVLKTPFPGPAASAKAKRREPLTPDQNVKYEELLRTVKAWSEVPSAAGKEGPLTEDEVMWLSRDCLLRYLRATKWRSTADAAKRLISTLTWRRDYGATTIDPDEMSIENETGKQMLLGYDVEQRVCHYMSPGRQNTNPSPRQIQHLVFMVERAVDLTTPEQETFALMINFKTSKTRSNTAPPLSQGREVLNILQEHYPERLGRGCVINLPWLVLGFFKLITPFIDPLTRDKLKFSEDMRLYVPTEQLWTEFKGEANFEYDHEVYWPALLKLCEDRRAAQRARWEKAGKIYGESEEYLKGGNVPSIGGGEISATEVEAGKGDATTDIEKAESVPLDEVTAEVKTTQPSD